jgi:hypothetical protein
MKKNKSSLEQVISQMVEWSETENGKIHINKIFIELEDASEKLREDASLKPEKLKILIGI